MRAAMFHGRRDVRIEEVPDPPLPGPGYVTLETILASVCGTDVNEYLHGPIMVPLHRAHPGSGHVGPTILGHEVLARVTTVGTGVDPRLVGTRVVPGAGVWCGSCSWCREGRTNLCARYYTLGLHSHGGLSDRMLAPARMCQPVPASCPDEMAVLGQTASIAVHALRRARGIGPGPLLLVGAGGVGSLIILAARAEGIETVVVDTSSSRLARAHRLGATYAIGAGSPARLRELSQGEGFPVVMEVSGTDEGLRMALSAVRRGGRVVLVGLQTGASALDLHWTVLQEIEVTTSSAHLCLGDLPAALQILTHADVAADDLIERVIPLDDLVTGGLEPLASGQVHRKLAVTPR